MTTTASVDRGERPRPAPHRLFVADTEANQRLRVTTWLMRELEHGSKVFYKGWPEDRDDGRHWLVTPEGPPAAAAALDTGQLEVHDYPTVIERCGGTTQGLLELQEAECARAVREGWHSIAMTQETTHRPMANAAEVAEFTAQEEGYELLARRWPLTSLCQLTLEVENAQAVGESISVHHRGVVDVSWSANQTGRQWVLSGALDAHVAGRFSSGLQGALAAARRSEGQSADLHLNLATVEFMDFACAQILVINARSVSHQQRIVVHGATGFLRNLIVATGRPRTLVFDDEVVG